MTGARGTFLADPALCCGCCRSFLLPAEVCSGQPNKRTPRPQKARWYVLHRHWLCAKPTSCPTFERKKEELSYARCSLQRKNVCRRKRRTSARTTRRSFRRPCVVLRSWSTPAPSPHSHLHGCSSHHCLERCTYLSACVFRRRRANAYSRTIVARMKSSAWSAWATLLFRCSNCARRAPGDRC